MNSMRIYNYVMFALWLRLVEEVKGYKLATCWIMNGVIQEVLYAKSEHAENVLSNFQFLRTIFKPLILNFCLDRQFVFDRNKQ